MWTDDDRTARLQRDEDLIDRCGCRVRGGNDRRDDAKGLGDFDDLAVFETVDYSNRSHWPDELVHLPRAKEVLLDLVLDDSVAGLFHGKARERLRVRCDRVRHRAYNRVDLFLSLIHISEPTRLLSISYAVF